jgi:beta-glucosidase
MRKKSMKKRKSLRPLSCLLAAILASVIVLVGPVQAQDNSFGRQIDSLLHLMTLEEKCGQLNQISWSGVSKLGAFLTEEERALVRQGLLGSFLNISGAAAVAEAQRVAVKESRLHIPLLLGVDVIHGFRTIFPVPLAEASSWDPELAERSARVAAIEASAAGIHWTFAPMVDIAREPRWGRIVEGSGEDPYLGSLMAAARVRGFQGNTLLDSTSILACAKHFAAYGGAEGGRDYNTVDMSERTLREIYLPPFKAAVDAGAGSIMSSFNEISGVPSSANRFLLTDVLRGEWHFNGFVVSDWTAVEELQRHGIAANRADAGALGLNAGVDLDMVSQIYQKELPNLVRSGRVREEVVNEAVRRVLRAKFKLGLFDYPTRGCTTERETTAMLTRDHLQIALEAARKSIVLLKNDRSVLPLSKHLKTIAVIGPLADSKSDPLGPWHGAGKPQDVVTVLEGIRGHVSPETQVIYLKGCEIEGDSVGRLSEAKKLAGQADVVILVLGEGEDMSGEASSRSDIDLPGIQNELLNAVTEAGTPAVLVLMNGRPLTITRAAQRVPAILETWFLGVQTGNAVADVLFGDVNPSGKLPVTFPRSVGQIPLYYNHKNTGRPFLEKDKYTSKYLDSPNTPLFPFGYGLSYTTFSYSNLAVNRPRIGMNDSVVVSVQVKNTGKSAGEEVVQLYVHDIVASVTRPVKELKAFRRIALQPGDSKTVSFALSPDQLAFYDLQMKRVVEPGLFKVYVGGNSVDGLENEFELVAN